MGTFLMVPECQPLAGSLWGGLDTEHSPSPEPTPLRGPSGRGFMATSLALQPRGGLSEAALNLSREQGLVFQPPGA